MGFKRGSFRSSVRSAERVLSELVGFKLAIAGVETDWTPFVVRVNTSKVVKVRAKGIKVLSELVGFKRTKEQGRSGF